MSNRQKVPFTTQTGQLVQGDVFEMQEKKDDNGRPVLDDKGNKIMELFFAIAVPKTPADVNPVSMQAGATVLQFPGWTQNEIGKLIFAEGFGARPTPAEVAVFAWKIDDGDSVLTRGTPPKRICDYEGFPGCWVYKFKSRFPVSCIYKYDAQRDAYDALSNGIKKGDYIQVAGSVVHNESQRKPGVHLNPQIVLLIGYGKEIMGGVRADPRAAGFNVRGALPPGASAVPIGVVPAGAGLPQAIPAPAAVLYGAPVGAPLPVPGVAAAAPVYVQPNPAIMPTIAAAPVGQVLPTVVGVPGLAVMPAPPAVQIPPPPVAAVAAGPALTAKANGATYAQMLGAGWTDATLRQNGYMV